MCTSQRSWSVPWFPFQTGKDLRNARSWLAMNRPRSAVSNSIFSWKLVGNMSAPVQACALQPAGRFPAATTCLKSEQRCFCGDTWIRPTDFWGSILITTPMTCCFKERSCSTEIPTTAEFLRAQSGSQWGLHGRFQKSGGPNIDPNILCSSLWALPRRGP